MVTLLAALELARNELLLFAGIGLLIGGIDDFAVDLLYGARRIWRDLTVYTRFPRMTAQDLPPSGAAGPIAVFVPAWDEAAVIGPMLRRCLTLWAEEDVRIFLGVYPNDPATIAAAQAVLAEREEDNVEIVVASRHGPTTKADCLNELWQALLHWEETRGAQVLAVVLHDAEDVVHADALRLIGALAPRFALVQLPVLPLVTARSKWVAGHYCDEFAESHGKALLVREALGAAVPSAGVGCGFNRSALDRIARARGGRPFDPESLTEDYELGLRLGEEGGRGILVRMRDAHGDLIATREYFPDTFAAAVRQKARWMTGIALAGWDRLGWRGGWTETWMRLRDRRAVLAALILASAYLGLILGVGILLAGWLGGIRMQDWPPLLSVLLWLNFLMLLWRVAVRMLFVWRAYGAVEAVRSVPRMVVSNIIALAAARRAMTRYVRHLRGQPLDWDKTAHRFPDDHAEGVA
ncbi:MAG: glycosyl transferase family protein [Sphingobium sp.]|nr:glycosyl transferase family protein [Sphingobium sp.]